MRHLQAAQTPNAPGHETRLNGIINGPLAHLLEMQSLIYVRVKDMRTRLVGSAPEAVSGKEQPPRIGTIGCLEDQLQTLSESQQKIMEELEALSQIV